MIQSTFEEAFSQEWIERNIKNPIHELAIIRQIIPWDKLVKRLSQFYHKSKGPMGKSIRIMVALSIVARFEKLSDREVIEQVKENPYIQYFCNVSDKGIQTFLHPTSLRVFRKRLGKKGVGIIEEEVFNLLRRVGVIRGDNMLMDSTVLASNIIYPNDVQLIHQAFKKMRSFCKLQGIAPWWDEQEVKKLWRGFGLDKDKQSNRGAWLVKFDELFIPALEAFTNKVESLNTSTKRKNKASKLLELLKLLQQQTLEKLSGEKHILNRIVSLDETDARPIKKGKSHPTCEFGTTSQMTFNREGFMITVENFIGNPGDKTLYPDTLDLYVKRMKGYPDTAITDLGYRRQDNFKYSEGKVNTVFLGKSSDVSQEKQEFCQKARSATEGFIAVAKNLRGFGRSLYRGLEGDRIWSLLCQTAYNLKKFLQLYLAEKLEDEHLIFLGL